jgi:hypothetical protein
MSSTKEEIKEFWEWCGFKPVDTVINGFKYHEWIHPDGLQTNWLPEIDLNNLFKYAVPKVTQIDLWTNTQWSEAKHTVIPAEYGATVKLYDEYKFGNGKDTDPALALFWAIYQVIKEK